MFFRRVFCFCWLIFAFSSPSLGGQIWEAKNSGIDDLDMRAITVSSGEEVLICAASRKNVYLSVDKGNFWEHIFSLPVEEGEVNFVTFDRFNPEKIYLATTRGLFCSEDRGQSWPRVFRRVSAAASRVNWIALDPFDAQRIYMGTGGGLYVSSDGGKSWGRCGGGLPHVEVRAVAVHPANSWVVYLANAYGLFKTLDGGESWKRVFITSQRIVDEEGLSEEESKNLINCIALDPRNPRKIFLATGRGIFASTDAGRSWGKLSARGLSADYINFVVVAADKESSVYAATRDGVYKFLPPANIWEKICQGMTALDVRSLSFNKEEQLLFAATERGIFRATDLKTRPEEKEKVGPPKERKRDYQKILREIAVQEPDIRQVQEAALKYAQVVHPQRIEALRWRARLRALLPEVSVDYAKTIYGTAGTQNYSPRAFVGPRDWSLTLSWDVGELLFSEQSRLLDSNARLLVQLRADILNEITRLYYERRRLQMELVLTPPQTATDKLNKILRLKELTANIDGLTGGWFSRQLKGERVLWP